MRALVLLLLLAPVAAAEPSRLPADAESRAALTADFIKAEPGEALSGGASTVPVLPDNGAFLQRDATLASPADFDRGRAIFQQLWIAAPSAITGSDGLGPLYNARACQTCHVEGGRAPAPGADGVPPGLLLRLGLPDAQAMAAHVADPTYGHQLQPLAAPGQAGEGTVTVTWTDLPVTLADGVTVTLREPTYGVTDPAYGPLAGGTILSPRIAPQMIGLGLLEAIPDAEILSIEDPDDVDGDGISGRANWLEGSLGRFGLKAGQPTLRDQSAQAFAMDMGLATSLLPDLWGDCTALQTACRKAPHGGSPEVPEESLDLVTTYSSALAVPARRDVDDPAVLRGKKVFYTLNCTGCHRSKHIAALPHQDPQLIWPYTDLLLHDMGPGLADGLPEGRASGREWRTPPLWGLGLVQIVNPEAGFLHDGRARTILEAVLWHGGEAQAQRDAVVNLATEDRAALIAFLESL